MAGHKYTQLSPFSSADKDRFRALIATEDAGGCWIWTGKKDAKGYGYFFAKNRRFLAHRVSYFMHFEVDPFGLFCCHRCDTPSCVNPEHMFLGTPQDNLRDMWSKGRGPSGSKHGLVKHPELVRRGADHPSKIHGTGYYVRGEKSPLTTLTDEKVLSIRAMYANGRSYNQVAAAFGISKPTVWKIVKRRSWSHLPPRP